MSDDDDDDDDYDGVGLFCCFTQSDLTYIVMFTLYEYIYIYTYIYTYIDEKALRWQNIFQLNTIYPSFMFDKISN